MEKNKKFEVLTKYISLLESDSFGAWQHDKTEEGVAYLPYISYTEVALEFKRAIVDFAKKNEEYGMKKYREVLEKNEILEFTEYNFSTADAKIILCMMMYVIRKERFCEGVFLKYLKNGYFNRWLERLKELDNN